MTLGSQHWTGQTLDNSGAGPGRPHEFASMCAFLRIPRNRENEKQQQMRHKQFLMISGTVPAQSARQCDSPHSPRNRQWKRHNVWPGGGPSVKQFRRSLTLQKWPLHLVVVDVAVVVVSRSPAWRHLIFYLFGLAFVHLPLLLLLIFLSRPIFTPRIRSLGHRPFPFCFVETLVSLFISYIRCYVI